MKDQCFREEEDSEVKVLIGPSSASGVVEIPDSEEEMELRVEICFNESPKENCIQSPTPKRKRMSGVVMSDTEEEPVYSELEKKKNMDVEVCLSTSTDFPVSDDEKTELRPRSRRRLVPLSQLRNGANSYSRKGGNFRQRLKVPVLQSRENDDEDEEPAGSESEGDSLDGFIESESNTFEDELSSNSGDVYSGRFFGRNHRGSSNMKWEYEGDMLASFGKDPVICMEAVCALYRQQTANEMSFKACLLCNNRGFNKIDARRASYIAEFLTDGDAAGPLVKSVDELGVYDREGVEYCYRLATRYSKQLFMVYQSGEDPHFNPKISPHSTTR